MPKTDVRDFPFAECCKGAERMVQDGATVYQKWTCVRCGERVTANNPNSFTTFGRHEEKADGQPCGGVTDIQKTGCNYRAVWVI
jgi:hypothetical protein